MSGPSSWCSRTQSGLGEQRTVHPRRHRALQLDLGPDGHQLALAGELAADLGVDVRRVGLAVDAQDPATERLDHLDRQRPGPEDPRLAVGAGGVVHGAGREQVEHAAVGEGEVDLDVVGVPLVGDRLDPDAGQAEVQAVVPHPGVHRLALVRVVGLGAPRRARATSSSPPVRSMAIATSPIQSCMRSV